MLSEKNINVDFCVSLDVKTTVSCIEIIKIFLNN